MPYIPKSRRDALFNDSTYDHNDQIVCAGELNYFITYLINEYLKYHGLNYQVCNDIVGALDNAKDEFKRCVQNPYEDLKIKENGDVYDKQFTRKRKK